MFLNPEQARNREATGHFPQRNFQKPVRCWVQQQVTVIFTPENCTTSYNHSASRNYQLVALLCLSKYSGFFTHSMKQHGLFEYTSIQAYGNTP